MFPNSQIRKSRPTCEQLGRHRWANTYRQPTLPNPVKQIGKKDAQFAHKGAMELFGMQRVHTELLANPCPLPGLRTNTRAIRLRAARLARENGKVEGLAKKVKVLGR